MLQFVESQTELTTAATDLLLGLLAVFCFLYLWHKLPEGMAKRLWLALFGFLALSSFLGAFAHAVRMEQRINDLLWHPLYFFLGLTLTLLALIAVLNWRGEPSASRAMRWLLPLPFVVVLVTWLGAGAFIYFVLFEAAIMLFVFGVYFRLVLKQQPGSRFVLAGVVLSIVAAILQAIGPYTFQVVWQFDHNGLFHLVQLPGVVFFFFGARSSVGSELSVSPVTPP